MKSYLITGAGSGLGRELALQLSQKNNHIILAGRTPEKLETVRQEIMAAGGSADILDLDVSNREMVMGKLSGLKLDGIVNNAGVGYFGSITDISGNQMRNMLETNLMGTIYSTQAILPSFLKNNKGHIVNIISTAGLRGKKNESVYAASKFAVRGFTESLQKELKETKIKVSAVYMGGMNTPFWESTDHIKDTGKLRHPHEVAKYILEHFDEETIILESRK